MTASRGPRIVVVGTTGSGKTTLARELAAALGIPHIELDVLFHGPDWTPRAAFRADVEAATDATAWVCEGNYSPVYDVVWSRGTELVWLDLPFPVVFRRLGSRTWRRYRRNEVLWNGNRERFWNQFTCDGLFVWALRTHWRRRRIWPRRLGEPAYRHLEVHRLRSPDEVEEWIGRHVRSGRPTPG